MNGLEFEEFCQKYKLTPNYNKFGDIDIELLYNGRPVCQYYRIPNTNERWIRFPGKWMSVKPFEKACECFEFYCRPIVKNIDVEIKLDKIKEDF